MEKVVEKICHTPSEIFQVEKRGFIRKGYYADLVLLKEETFQYKVDKTFVNGHLAYNNTVFDESKKGMRLSFER
nr:amidohydrolase family protein [Labilibaculum filiforme]